MPPPPPPSFLSKLNEDFAARLAEEKRKLQAAVLDRETQAAGVESELEQQRQQLVCCGRGGEGEWLQEVEKRGRGGLLGGT